MMSDCETLGCYPASVPHSLLSEVIFIVQFSVTIEGYYSNISATVTKC